MAEHVETDVLITALERLRLRHLTFRRIEPEDIRELEAMRLDLLKFSAEMALPPSAQELEAVAAIQLRLLERAFHVLRLDQFANAPENQGWINLFRQWGRSDSFNAHYERAKLTLTRQCRGFYEMYLQSCPESMDDRPIHHPWHRPEDAYGPGLFMDTGLVEPMIAALRARPGAGGVEDAKGGSGPDQTYEQPSDGSGEGKGGSTKND